MRKSLDCQIIDVRRGLHVTVPTPSVEKSVAAILCIRVHSPACAGVAERCRKARHRTPRCTPILAQSPSVPPSAPPLVPILPPRSRTRRRKAAAAALRHLRGARHEPRTPPGHIEGVVVPPLPNNPPLPPPPPPFSMCDLQATILGKEPCPPSLHHHAAHPLVLLSYQEREGGEGRRFAHPKY